MKKTVFLIIFLTLQVCLSAQNQQITDADKKTDWWGNVDGYINQQDKVSLELVNNALKKYPPSLKEKEERKMALLMIDNVLHEAKAPERPAVQDFFRKRIENAIEEISSAKVEKGAVIWKLYNHAFVVKTKSVTLGFDIQRGLPGVEEFKISEDLMVKLIDNVDILFITHFHDDHADEWVAESFLARNKPVVTPKGIFPESPIYRKILHPEREAGKKQEISLPGKGIKLRVVVFPGHQEETILNNVYLVFTPEGISVLHTGDQSNTGDFVWIDHIGDNYPVDVAMVNSWSYYPGQRLANGIRPKLIIPGHENELGHSIDHREPYWLNYNRLGDGIKYPWIQMTWGESYHYIHK